MWIPNTKRRCKTKVNELEEVIHNTPPEAIDVDLGAWRAIAHKLSLKETGELMRALVRARSLKHPNREQRMLLAVFARNPEEGVAS